MPRSRTYGRFPTTAIGTIGGNPSAGRSSPRESAAAVGVTGLSATVTTSIQFVGDGIPDGYNSTTNYKQVTVTVTRNLDDRTLASESTYIAPPSRAPYGGISQVALGAYVTDVGDNQPVPGVAIALTTGPSAPLGDTTDTNGGVLFAGMTANPSTGANAYYTVVPTIPAGYVEMPGDIKTAQLAPGAIQNLSIRVYQPATIYLHLTSGGSDYTGNATVTVTPASGTAQNYSVGGDPGGSYSIPNITPNAEYTVTASNSVGLISKAVGQWVPNNYPDDLTSSFTLDLAPPTGTLSVTTLNGGTPIAGVALTVTGGPSGVTLHRNDGRDRGRQLPLDPGRSRQVHGHRNLRRGDVPNAGTGRHRGDEPADTRDARRQRGRGEGVDHRRLLPPAAGGDADADGPERLLDGRDDRRHGTWTFPNVGTGTGYALSATDGAASASTTAISVATGVTTNIALSLFVGTIKVSVTDGLNPLTDIPVTLTGPNSLVVIGTTDATGSYSFANIGAGGGYAVSAADGAATASTSGLSVSAGGTTTANLTLPAGSILATITENGAPLPNAKVTVTGPNAFSTTVHANASGVATITGVGSGAGYTVTAFDGPGSAQQTGVSVSTGSTTERVGRHPGRLAEGRGRCRLHSSRGDHGHPDRPELLLGDWDNGLDRHLHLLERRRRRRLHRHRRHDRLNRGPDRSCRDRGRPDPCRPAAPDRVDPHCRIARNRLVARPDGDLDRPELVFRQRSDRLDRACRLQRRSGGNRVHRLDDLRLDGHEVRPRSHEGGDHGRRDLDPGRIAEGDGPERDRNRALRRGADGFDHEWDHGGAGKTGSNGTYTFNLPVATGYKVTADIRPGLGEFGEPDDHERRDDDGHGHDPDRDGDGQGPELGRDELHGRERHHADRRRTPSRRRTRRSVAVSQPSRTSRPASVLLGVGNLRGGERELGRDLRHLGEHHLEHDHNPDRDAQRHGDGRRRQSGRRAGDCGLPGRLHPPGHNRNLGRRAWRSHDLGRSRRNRVLGLGDLTARGSGTTTGVAVTGGSTTAATVAVPVGTLAVTVTLAGSNVSGATVTVTNTGGFSVTGTTNGSGIATLSNIPAATGYSISATSGGATATATGVAVTAGNTTASTIAIPTGSVRVTVTVGSAYGPAVVTLTNSSGYSANLTTPSTGARRESSRSPAFRSALATRRRRTSAPGP